MSEFNEELLNDDTDDFPELGEAEEDALLQDDDDGDVLNLVPEEELGDELEPDSKHAGDSETKRGSRHDKFATERKRITAPEPTSTEEKPVNNRYVRQPNHRARGRGGRFQQQQGRHQQFSQGRQYNLSGQPGRNKTVLINPRFQGVVHVNNNARLAWDTQQHQFQSNPWASNGPPANMGPPMQPHPQGPPQLHFQPPMPQFQGPPQMQAMQRPLPPMQNMGPPMQQLTFTPPQHAFLPQPLPPGVPHSPMQPPNLPPPSSYWDGQNQVSTFPQGPNQIIPYVQNNYEPPPPIIINTSQPPPQIQLPNYHYNNQFNNGPPMQHQQHINQNYVQQNRAVFADNMRPPQGNLRQQQHNNTFSPKRKVSSVAFGQNKKRFLQARLGPMDKSQIKTKNFLVKTEDRPSVVKEVTVTNVTTVKIEEDDQMRDLRLKIEDQRKKREQVLQWKELRRRQEQDRGVIHQQVRGLQQNLGGSVRTPVLQPIKQIDEHKPFRGKARNQKIVQNINQRVVTAPAVQMEEPVDEKHLSTFLADRKVLVKDETLMATRKVVINNISTSTGDKKIFEICRSIGEVQKLHRDQKDRHATITFKSVASAHAFFKKYQRHMLDLSMIEVSLTPESDEKD